MAIVFDKQTKTFYLEGKSTTYAFFINKFGYAEHLYYGSRIGRDPLFYTRGKGGRSCAATVPGEKIDGFRKIHVDVYIESYSLYVTARGNTNYVRVGDETCYFSTDAISYDGTAKKMTHVASHTFTTDTDNATLPIYALWNFNGVYSDKPISAIIVENTINL